MNIKVRRKSQVLCFAHISFQHLMATIGPVRAGCKQPKLLLSYKWLDQYKFTSLNKVFVAD